MNDALNKMVYIYKYLDALFHFKDEKLNDHTKKSVLRYYFILLDDLLKIVGYLKNDLSKKSKITNETKKKLEEHIKNLQTSYDKQYDTIRDKFGAHQQELNLLDLINWWNEIDFITISIFHDDVFKIKSELIISTGNIFQDISDYSPIDFSSAHLLAGDSSKYYLSSDRLALIKENTVGLIPIHKSQEKAQIILSIINLTLDNFKLTKIVNNPDTVYRKCLFDTLWLLIICDCCSLIDNLYEDINNKYIVSSSLLQQWKDLDMKGYKILEDGNSSRDHTFEMQLRVVRDKFGAHIDKNFSMTDIYNLYNLMDLSMVHKYFLKNAYIFKEGCLADIRTKPFTFLDTELKGVTGIESSSYKRFKD